MKLLLGFLTSWVFLMLIEIIWLMNDISAGARNKEEIYVIMLISLVVGATGLNILSNHLKK